MGSVKVGLGGQVPVSPSELNLMVRAPMDAPVLMVAVPKATKEGHAGVMVGVRPERRWVSGLATLREIYSATKAMVVASGEDWMHREWGLLPRSDREGELAALCRQLLTEVTGWRLAHPDELESRVPGKQISGANITLDTTALQTEWDAIERILRAADSLDRQLSEHGVKGTDPVAAGHWSDAWGKLHEALAARRAQHPPVADLAPGNMGGA